MRWTRRGKPNLGAHRLVREESGQSLIVVAGAIITLIAIIGLGVDLGVVYVEKVRLARAMDAAALAGAQELPIEEAAHKRALEYLVANGYGAGEACIETLGSSLGSASCAGSEADTIITIDTERFRDEGQENTANRITVYATQKVPLNFMRVLGVVDEAPVAASATAENIDNLDIAIVYDRSGSMQEDTRCYGCWEPVGEYPGGNLFPLPFEDPDTGVVIHCQESDPVNFEGRWYISIEAEHYSQYLIEADYHRENTEFPKTWWAMQRQPNRNASGPDERGAWMKLGPDAEAAIRYYNLSDILYPPDLYTTPRLDYDFTVPEYGTYFVWIRAQGGRFDRRIHVGLDGVPMGTGYASYNGPYNDGAYSNRWSWNRVLTLNNLNAGDLYTLNFWAAVTGFRLDKIVITNDSRTNLVSYGRPLGWDRPGVSDAGPVETHGRTNWACLEQDPRFTPVDPVYGQDDLYDDRQPIRAAKQAAKNFVRRLNPELDQIAYAQYNASSTIREELYCIKRYGSCADFENVVGIIEATTASGSTNIADALWDGIRVLTTGREPSNDGEGFPSKDPGAEHYGRPSAAHILVLMTDGQANYYPYLPSGYGNCYSDNLWDDVPGESTNQRRGRECVAWFAHQARDQAVVVYTIGLGAQADNELLAYVADITGGWYYFAPSAEELDDIFDNLYERIFLRLTD
jgi:Flp pilus assembly protein TadG